jgi:hypothetical protein
VDVRRDARLAVQPGGEADVVGVPVREDERPHVIEALDDRGKFARSPFQYPGSPASMIVTPSLSTIR